MEREAVEPRSLRFSPTGGVVLVNGVLDTLGAATIRTALEPLARRAGRDDHRRFDQRMAAATMATLRLCAVIGPALHGWPLPALGALRAYRGLTTRLPRCWDVASSSSSNVPALEAAKVMVRGRPARHSKCLS